MSSIESIFESFGVTLSAEEQRRDELKKIVKEVDDVTRALNVSTQQLHENLSSALTSLNARVASALPTVRASFAKLSANIEPREFSKYSFVFFFRCGGGVLLFSRFLKSTKQTQSSCGKTTRAI